MLTLSATRYPYGATRSSAMGTDYRYTGQRQEAGLGLYDYNSRYYDPSLGRFIQADTIVPEPGNPQALNRYSYVYNNPLKYSDPSGHMHQRATILGLDGPAVESPLTEFYGLSWEYSDKGAFHPLAEAGRDELWPWFEAHPDYSPANDPAMLNPVGFGVNYPFAPEYILRHYDEWQSYRNLRLRDVFFLPGGAETLIAGGASIAAAWDQRSSEVAAWTQAYSGPRGKPVNLPAWKSVTIDMEHISSGHMEGGTRVSSEKTLFPHNWSQAQVRQAVRQAYRYSSRIGTQGDRVLLSGSYQNMTIEMWVNLSTTTIETAYPLP